MGRRGGCVRLLGGGNGLGVLVMGGGEVGLGGSVLVSLGREAGKR